MRKWTSVAINIAMGLLMVVAFALAFFWVPPAKDFAERYGNGHIAKIIFVHVPLAIVSFIGFIAAAGFGLVYLLKRDARWDDISYALVEVGWIYALLATVTGAYFSKLAWGEWWSEDPRQITMLLVLLTYTAYLLIRVSIESAERKAAISAVYAILGAIASVFFYWVIPYLPTVMTASAHPSGIIVRGGLDFSYRLVLQLSLLGFLLAFVQLVRLRASISRLERQRLELALKETEV